MDIRIKEAVANATIQNNDPVFSPSLITFFNVSPQDITSEDKRKLSEIDKLLEGEDDLAKIQHLRTLRMRLAPPNIGQSDIDNLHKYLKLNGAVKENMAQAEAMEADVSSNNL